MLFTFQFSSNWYLLSAAFLTGWLTIAIIRKKHLHKKEAKQQLLIGILGTAALALMELFAVSTNLWNYIPANWPAILWPTYFVAILFGYQLVRFVEKIVPH